MVETSDNNKIVIIHFELKETVGTIIRSMLVTLTIICGLTLSHNFNLPKNIRSVIFRDY